MPEGNTVWLTAQRLRHTLAGHPLRRAEFRVGTLSTVDLTGHQIIDVVPRGKHLLMRFDTGHTLHSHLRMDGTWRIRPAGWSMIDPRDEVRLVFGTESATAVGYRIHDIALIPTAAEGELVGHLGPDLLGPDWDADEATRRLAANPATPVAQALLDQRNLAGAGNVYKAEACYLRGISPWTAVHAVPDLHGLVDLLHRLLVANRERYDHVTTGDPRPGRRTWVYGRADQPCRRCATPIAVAWQGEPARISYWCPHCQPGPEPGPRLRSRPARELATATEPSRPRR